MSLLETRDGLAYFQVEHGPRYMQLQREFFLRRLSPDPRQVADLLNLAPYHLDALLLMSGVVEQGGDFALCTDFVGSNSY